MRHALREDPAVHHGARRQTPQQAPHRVFCLSVRICQNGRRGSEYSLVFGELGVPVHECISKYFHRRVFQSQFLLSLQAISTMVHFYMGTKGPENVSLRILYNKN